ncbi:DUF3060 domain-containing protein [Mycolicibacterium sp. 018/SC-01/001]|uniref:DUF3060 domain-containing protein n=1 Tax=Mycolicibacterium sp. 018/SC-01/001 TaxID=2592069 RepID=UPI00117D6D29|nr:DUF3060 domain-containing protein [Mycolicibacterium sp. 018/SC-01/001]TRW81825.1 DUF3060 domain-containing protein [Mycolicibacterium sp. 018/SC-01/001]
MEPTGDPEARIRDLERPLAGQADTSELGDSTVPVPPYPHSAPPPDPYGSPYWAPPQQVVRKRPNSATWVIPLIAGIVVIAGVIGVAVFFVLGDSSVVGRPSVSGGGGTVAQPTVPVIPSMPSIPPIPGTGGEDQVITVEAGGSLSIGGVDRRQTVICNEGTVSISGMNNTIEVQGSCAEVSVSGMENKLTVESAGTIGVSGFDNTVTYRSGDPKTSQSGSGNTIERG